VSAASNDDVECSGVLDAALDTASGTIGSAPAHLTTNNETHLINHVYYTTNQPSVMILFYTSGGSKGAIPAVRAVPSPYKLVAK